MRLSHPMRFLLILVLPLLVSLPLPAQQTPPPADAPKPPQDSKQAEKPKAKEDATQPAMKVEKKIEVKSRYVPEDSTMATKYPVDPQMVPASISSVSSTLLDEQNATTLNEAMNNVAGATTNADGGFIQAFTLRGFDSADSDLLLVNGSYEPRTGVNQTYNIDRIEVVRGPIGFLYGGNAMAGAVNLVRKQPLAEDFNSVEVLAGSYDTGRLQVDMNHQSPDSRVLFRLNAMSQSSGGYRDREGLKAFALNPSLTLRLTERTSLNFDLEGEHTEDTLDMGIPVVNGQIPDVPRTRNFGSPFDKADQDTGRMQINLQSELDPALTLHNKAYFTDQNWTDAGASLAAVVPTVPGDALLIRIFGALTQQVHVLGDQFDTTYRYGSGSIRNELVAGVEAQQLRVESTVGIGLLPPIDLQNPVETAQKPIVFIPGAGFAVNLRILTLAPYALDVLQLGDRWQLSVGGRVDSIDQNNAVLGQTHRETDFSPFLGVLYSPSNRLSLYGNFGEGFNPISLGVVNKDPRPEKSRGEEVGVKTQAYDGRLRASVAVYKLKKDNIAIIDSTGFVAQLGDQQSKGAELEVSADPMPGLDMLFVYGYTDAVLTRFTQVDPLTGGIDDFSGNAPTWAPKNVFNSWIGKKLSDGIRVAGGIRYVGTRFEDQANEVSIAGYTTLNTSLSYERSSWSTTLYLNNLTNAKYETRGFSAVVPSPGFNVSLAVRHRM